MQAHGPHKTSTQVKKNQKHAWIRFKLQAPAFRRSLKGMVQENEANI